MAYLRWLPPARFTEAVDQRTAINDKHGHREIPPELAQYLAQSVADTLSSEAYEALLDFTPEELQKLTRLGEALRRHDGCEPDPCLRTTFAIH